MEISNQTLSLKQLSLILNSDEPLCLSESAKQAIVTCREYLDNKIAAGGKRYYGVNTGFGSLCDVEISPESINQLQENLVMSHACGMGQEVPQEIVRLMLLLKIQSLSYGHSGVALSTVERLIAMYNKSVLPIVYTQGSLGASGDLAPLAHLSLPLIGKGECWYQGNRYSGEAIEEMFGWNRLTLQSKEGLALLNGTHFMSAYGVYILLRAQKLVEQANFIASASLDAYACRLEPFNALVHRIRPHKGQLFVAQAIQDLLQESELAEQEKTQVQDPYSFRCIPQVHGASWDTIQYVESVFTTEANSVTDNPNVFPEEDEIISAGNFHGQPLALALDFLKIALAEIGNISERRTYLLLSGNRNLPVYLSPKPGLNSGLMIPQYTAASIVSKNKQLCSPASVDSIPSSNGQEDHVSMGANAAVQCLEILENVQSILAIEWMTAAQALSLRQPKKSSPRINTMLDAYRKEVAQINEDRVLYTDLEITKQFVKRLNH